MLGIFLDTETNGLNPKIHRTLDLAYKIVNLRTGQVQDEYQTIVAQPIEIWRTSDPESLKVNGFTWDELANGLSPQDAAKQIIDRFASWNIKRKEAVFICQNPSFDRIFFSQLIDPETQELLRWPYHWLDLASMHWAIAMEKAKKGEGLFPWETGLSKDLIASYYHLAKEATPHRAMNGVSHLIACYKAVVGFPIQ